VNDTPPRQRRDERNVKQGTEAGNAEVWETRRGNLLITQPALGVMLFTYRGHMSADVVPFVERSVGRLLAAGVRPDLFVDVEAMTGYDSAYRKAITAWGLRTQRQCGEVHFFVRSRLVAMGIAVSNLAAAGRLRATTHREQFETALGRAVARHSAAPAPHWTGPGPAR